MEEKYLYRSALEHCWLSISQIQERIQKKPHQKHERVHWPYGAPSYFVPAVFVKDLRSH